MQEALLQTDSLSLAAFTGCGENLKVKRLTMGLGRVNDQHLVEVKEGKGSDKRLTRRLVCV